MSGLGVEALALELARIARVDWENTARRPEDEAPNWLPVAYGLLASPWYAATVADVARRIRDELEPPIDRVRRLHTQHSDLGLAPGRWCPGCGHEEPCPTIRALNGD